MSNVLDFGAAGDGTADESSALQHALDAGDGVLRLNKGTYRISRPLVLDLTRTGFGGVRGEVGTSRLVMSGPGPAVRVVGDHQGTAAPASYQPHTWENERFPILSEIEIVGAHPQADGIELVRTTKCVISQVLVRRCQVGVRLVERNRDVIIADSHLYDNDEVGLLFDHCNLHQIIVHGCHISWNKQAGIKSLGGDVHNLQIVGNDIEYNNLTAGRLGAAPASAELAGHAGGSEILFDARDGIISEVTISGNTIQATVQTGGANIRVIGAPVERPQLADGPADQRADTAHLINITGNVLGSQWRGIELQFASRVSVTGNTIYDSADLSLFASHSSGLVIGGNTISWRGKDSEPSKDGLRFEDCDNVLVTGLATQRCSAGSIENGGAVTFVRCRESSLSDSQILDAVHRGVELIDCLRCRVTNNTIVDRRRIPSMQQAIRLTGDCRDNLLMGNILGGAVGPPIVAPAAAGTDAMNLLAAKPG
ncbi:MAG: right-handed parallel beta-helix repeat-containing protein [Planctomycetales bacterium]